MRVLRSISRTADGSDTCSPLNVAPFISVASWERHCHLLKKAWLNANCPVSRSGDNYASESCEKKQRSADAPNCTIGNKEEQEELAKLKFNLTHCTFNEQHNKFPKGLLEPPGLADRGRKKNKFGFDTGSDMFEGGKEGVELA